MVPTDDGTHAYPRRTDVRTETSYMVSAITRSWSESMKARTVTNTIARAKDLPR